MIKSTKINWHTLKYYIDNSAYTTLELSDKIWYKDEWSLYRVIRTWLIQDKYLKRILKYLNFPTTKAWFTISRIDPLTVEDLQK